MTQLIPAQQSKSSPKRALKPQTSVFHGSLVIGQKGVGSVVAVWGTPVAFWLILSDGIMLEGGAKHGGEMIKLEDHSIDAMFPDKILGIAPLP